MLSEAKQGGGGANESTTLLPVATHASGPPELEGHTDTPTPPPSTGAVSAPRLQVADDGCGVSTRPTSAYGVENGPVETSAHPGGPREDVRVQLKSPRAGYTRTPLRD